MRIGIYGGTFDPIHLAHLLLADTAAEQLRLDRLHLVPAAQSPLKEHPPTAARQRLEMLHLAIGGDPRLHIEQYEIQRGEVSYTVDTLQHTAESYPDAELFLIVGADAAASFDRWKDPARICQLATLAIAYRGGVGPPPWDVVDRYLDDAGRTAVRNAAIDMPQIELAASEIRTRVAAGRSIRYRVPAAVAAYIAAEGLYR